MIGSYLYIQTTVKLQCSTTVSFVVSGVWTPDTRQTGDIRPEQLSALSTDYRVQGRPICRKHFVVQETYFVYHIQLRKISLPYTNTAVLFNAKPTIILENTQQLNLFNFCLIWSLESSGQTVTLDKNTINTQHSVLCYSKAMWGKQNSAFLFRCWSVPSISDIKFELQFRQTDHHILSCIV